MARGDHRHCRTCTCKIERGAIYISTSALPTHDQVLAEQLKDLEFKAEWEALARQDNEGDEVIE